MAKGRNYRIMEEYAGGRGAAYVVEMQLRPVIFNIWVEVKRFPVEEGDARLAQLEAAELMEALTGERII